MLALGLGQVLPPHLHDHVDQDDGEERQETEHEPSRQDWDFEIAFDQGYVKISSTRCRSFSGMQ